MGHKSSKNRKQQPEEDIQDMIFSMRMTSKQFQNAAKRAQRDQEKEIKKAREVPYFLENPSLIPSFRH